MKRLLCYGIAAYITLYSCTSTHKLNGPTGCSPDEFEDIKSNYDIEYIRGAPGFPADAVAADKVLSGCWTPKRALFPDREKRLVFPSLQQALSGLKNRDTLIWNLS
jgi:hypothetical protein